MRAFVRLLRPSEVVVLLYLVYTTVLGLARPIDPSIKLVTIGINASVIAACFLGAYADSFRRRTLLGALRDWYTLPMLLLGYREMGWFALPHANTALEQSWIVWDRLLLNDWGLRLVVESLGPLGPSILEIAYSLVYAMGPMSVTAIYLTGHRKHADRFLFHFVLAVLTSNALLPLFPSEPPRTVFPGQDLPLVTTIFRRFNLWYLGELGIHMGVFPSAHVAGAFGAAIGFARVVPERKWLSRGFFILATLIATATVYCRYHYLVDALAGLAVALAASRVALWVYRTPRSTAARGL